MASLSLVVSGEGTTDFGCIEYSQRIEDHIFEPGALYYVVKSLLKLFGHEIDDDNFEFLHKTELGKIATAGRGSRSQRFRTSDQGDGNMLHQQRARALGKYALEKGKDLAFFHRDTDPRSGVPRDKCNIALFNSMQAGFEESGLQKKGIPVIPNPCLESWIICALKQYVACAALEETLGGTSSSLKNAKAELEKLIKEVPTKAVLVDLVKTIEVARIDMPSFNRFKQALEEALEGV